MFLLLPSFLHEHNRQKERKKERKKETEKRISSAKEVPKKSCGQIN